jgi:hypothetical protein
MPSSGILRRKAFVRTDGLRHHGGKNQQARKSVSCNYQLNHAAKLILFILMTGATRSSETSALTKVTQRNIQETTFFKITAVKPSNVT